MSLTEFVDLIDGRPEWQFEPPNPSDTRELSERIIRVRGDMPSDLQLWFDSHGGQRAGGRVIDDAVSHCLSPGRAREAWEFFLDGDNEFMEPFEPQWLPLLSNESGDYVVYDLRSGNLLSYWHDEEERDLEFKSLNDWAADVVRAQKSSTPKQNTFIETASPDSLVVGIQHGPGLKNVALAKQIQQVAGFPLMETVKKLSAPLKGEMTFSWRLSEATDRLDRAARVRAARQVADAMQAAGVKASVSVRRDDATETASLSQLEQLELRCLSE